MTADLPDRAADRARDMGPCFECHAPHADCTGPAYCCEDCLHLDADWEGYAEEPFTAPDDGEAVLPRSLGAASVCTACGVAHGRHKAGCRHLAPSSPDDSEARQWPCVYDYERTQCIREGHDHAAPSSPGSGDALHGRLAEALRQHRWTAEETPSGSSEEDYRPGAPCMDCGEYPGPRHQRSDCVRALAAALLPVVREAIADELDGAADWFARGMASWHETYLRARADALRDGTRA